MLCRTVLYWPWDNSHDTVESLAAKVFTVMALQNGGRLAGIVCLLVSPDVINRRHKQVASCSPVHQPAWSGKQRTKSGGWAAVALIEAGLAALDNTTTTVVVGLLGGEADELPCMCN